jgi:hypothetical protein
MRAIAAIPTMSDQSPPGSWIGGTARCLTQREDGLQSTIDTSRDWRLQATLGLTLVWLALGPLYIYGVPGWSEFVRQRAPDLGGFLEGAFAPLAFAWLGRAGS